MAETTIDLSEFAEEMKTQEAYEPPPPAPVPGGQVQAVYVPATIHLKDGTEFTTDAWGYSPLGVYAGGTWRDGGEQSDVLIPYEQIVLVTYHYESETEDESPSS